MFCGCKMDKVHPEDKWKDHFYLDKSLPILETAVEVSDTIFYRNRGGGAEEETEDRKSRQKEEMKR